MDPGRPRVEYAGSIGQPDAAASRPLQPVRLHVDVLLHFTRKLGSVSREQRPKIAGEDVELLEVGVAEGQDLRQEGIEAVVLPEAAPEVGSHIGVEIAEPIHDAPASRAYSWSWVALRPK